VGASETGWGGQRAEKVETETVRKGASQKFLGGFVGGSTREGATARMKDTSPLGTPRSTCVMFAQNGWQTKESVAWKNTP
jgi:hypothetical protein